MSGADNIEIPVFLDEEIAESKAITPVMPAKETPAQEAIDRVVKARENDTKSIDQPVRKSVAPVLPDDMKPNVLVVGRSGSGKSSSIEHLDPEKTIILSTEMKKLPFRGHKKFKMNTPITTYAQFRQSFARALASEKADTVVLDSFTSLHEIIYRETIRRAAKTEGFDAWNAYADAIQDVLFQSKTSNKYVIFMGIDMETQDHEQRITRSIEVQGKRMKGKIEKEFVVVLFTHIIEADMSDEDTTSRYCFQTNSTPSACAKSPKGMFDKLYIPNDLNMVVESMKKYYDED